MLTIRRHNAKEFAFTFSGTCFHRLLHIASNMLTSRAFDKKAKIWHAPFVCMEELLRYVERDLPGEPILISAEAQKAHDEMMAWRSALDEAQKRGLRGQEQPESDVPSSFLGKLPPYQHAALEWLSEVLANPDSSGAILGDVVGLGKTIEAIGFIEHLRDEGKLDSAVIICPSSLKRKWAAEIKKFTGFDAIVVEPKSKSTPKKWDAIWSVPRAYTILNYDVVWRYWDQIKKLPMDCLVLDEIQYVKNHSAKRSRFTRRLAKLAPFTVGMSATFLENTLEDLYSVFQIIDPSLFLGGFMVFDRHFIVRNWFRQITGYQNLDVVRDRIAPFVLRRHKEDVADQLRGAIADKVIESNYWIQLSAEQRRFYNEIKAGIVGKIEYMERAGKIVMAEVLAQLTYLRQACLSTALVGAKPGHVHSSKLDELLRIIEGFEPSEKFVIFAHFTQMVDIIGHALAEAKIPALVVHGKITKPNERHAICERFNTDPEIRAIVTSDAMREGVDLQGGSTLINFDLLWNPQNMKQRVGRIDRVGQKSPILHVINLIAEDTVEERMKEVLDTKQALFDAVVEGDRVEARLTLREVKGLLA